jgi:lipopolysaccharide biosynthesis protein
MPDGPVLQLLRGAARFSHQAGRSAHGLGSYLLSFARVRPHYIRQRWPGALDLEGASKVAIFSHYDRRGVVHEFVHFYVREIAKADYTLIFASSAPELRPADLARLMPVCGLVLRRRNLCPDFGNFKDAIACIPDLRRLETLLIVNDSVYGPFHDLADVLGRMAMASADVWSITDNWERRFHLQTYFVLFGRRALQSEAFHRFWRRLRYVQAKVGVVRRYEIGLTQALLRGGLRCRALFPHRAVIALTEAVNAPKRDRKKLDPRRKRFLAEVAGAIDQGTPLNATHFLWDFLIGEMGCPFLKRDLLQRNPVRIPGLLRWEEVIRSVSQYDTDLIVRHLETSVRNRSV